MVVNILILVKHVDKVFEGRKIKVLEHKKSSSAVGSALLGFNCTIVRVKHIPVLAHSLEGLQIEKSELVELLMFNKYLFSQFIVNLCRNPVGYGSYKPLCSEQLGRRRASTSWGFWFFGEQLWSEF